MTGPGMQATGELHSFPTASDLSRKTEIYMLSAFWQERLGRLDGDQPSGTLVVVREVEVITTSLRGLRGE